MNVIDFKQLTSQNLEPDAMLAVASEDAVFGSNNQHQTGQIEDIENILNQHFQAKVSSADDVVIPEEDIVSVENGKCYIHHIMQLLMLYYKIDGYIQQI